MERPKNDMTKVLNKTRYRVANSTLLGHDHAFRRECRFLYRSPSGLYFRVRLGSLMDELMPIAKSRAYDYYEDLDVQDVEPEEAFPEVAIAEA